MSEISLGFGNPNSGESSSDHSTVASQANRVRRQYFVDSASVVLVCPSHRKLALAPLSSQPNRNQWFPLIELGPEEGFDEATTRLIAKLLNTNRRCYTDLQLIDTLSLEVPECGEFVKRLLFYTELDAVIQKSPYCPCSTTETDTWFGYSEVGKLGNLHGPEPLIIAAHLDKNGPGLPEIHPTAYCEISIQELASTFTSGPNLKLFSGAGCELKEAIQVYGDFVQQCFPSPYMNSCCFVDYLESALPDLAILDMESLMNAFDVFNRKTYLEFFEFLSGLAAMDPATPHGGSCGVARLGYIFRFFDKSRGDGLSFEELSKFARDLIFNNLNQDNSVEISLSDNQVVNLVETMYKLFKVEFKMPVMSSSFSQGIASEAPELRGTSKLFRCQVSPIKQICNYPRFPVLQVKPSAKSTCVQCRTKAYTLALHSVTMLPNGSVVEPVLLSNLSNVLDMHWEDKIHSEKVSSKDFLANRILDLIRDFSTKKGASDWEAKRLDEVAAIQKVCSQAVEVLSCKARLLRLQAPSYIFGDLGNGSLQDGLLTFEHVFWRMGVACLTSSYLFLGNYLDGPHPIESALFLIGMTILAPRSFHLLRGKQECVRENRHMMEVCNAMFDQRGPAVLEALCSVFDSLPLAALIDEQLFCAHGGIPSTVTQLDEFDAVIWCPLKKPSDCPLAWELLWNEPAEVAHKDKQEKANSSAFMANPKCSGSFLFTAGAVDAFFAVNSLSHAIVSQSAPGFRHYFDGKILAVSSCTAKETKNAVILLVGLDGKIRPIKIEVKQTTDNLKVHSSEEDDFDD